MSLLIHLRIAGLLQVLLALFHLLLPKPLRWKEELPRLSLVNRQIFEVHTFFIGLVLVLFGALSIGWATALTAPSPLAQAITGGLALFWAIRLYVQWGVYDTSLWRGHRFNTVVQFGFTALWTYLTLVYALLWWRRGA